MRLALGLAALLSAFGFWACSDNDTTAGTATQTENTVASLDGVVYHVDGTRAKGAVVRLVLPIKEQEKEIPNLRETETDDLGRFKFVDVPADTFQLAVIDSASGEILYLPQASADDDSLVLERASLIKGYLTYDDSVLLSISVGSHFKVYVADLPFYETVFAPGSFELMVPEGSWKLGFCPGDPMVVEKLQESGLPDSVVFRSLEMSKTLKAGETLVLDTLVWGVESGEPSSPEIVDKKDSSDKKDTVETPPEPKAWISGQVNCGNLKSCDSVEVMVITDLFGFKFASERTLEYEVQALTDSLGRWWLPAPEEVPYDSFRVEYRQRSGETVTNVGLSRYVKKSELDGRKDTLSVGKTTLDAYSWISVGVRLVVDQESQQDENCLMNSVVLGIEGTSHFVRTLTCDKFLLTYLPSGMQRLLMYSGDPVVVATLQEAGLPMAAYVNSSDQNLTAGNGIKELWLTFTPPSLK